MLAMSVVMLLGEEFPKETVLVVSSCREGQYCAVRMEDERGGVRSRGVVVERRDANAN